MPYLSARIFSTSALMAAFALGGTVMLAGCEASSSKASPAANAQESDAKKNQVDPIPVETMTIHARDHVESFSAFGTMAAVESVTVSAEASGRALSVPFEEGERIKAGSRLLRVDTQLDSARIDVVESQVESAQREYERTQRLAKQGLATPQQLDQAESALESAQLNLKQAKVAASKGGVRSPITGIVSVKHIEEGEFAGAGAPVATIIKLDRLKVIANVPESRLQFVSEGDEVEVSVPAMKTDFTAKIHRVGIDPLPETRTYPVELRVENPGDKLRPGMHVRAHFVKKVWKDAVIVPRDAVLQGFSGTEAMIYPSKERETGDAELRGLTLGPNAGAEVVVESGLEAGQQIIVRGHRGLVDGALVRQVNHWESLEAFRNPEGRIDLSSSEDETGSSEQ